MLKDGQTFQSFFLYWMEMQLLHKCRYKANALSLGTSNCKKGTWTLSIAHIKQKSSVTLAIVSKNNSRAVYIASSESCEPKRFSLCWSKVERKCTRTSAQPNQSHCYYQNKGFVYRMNNNQINSTVTTRTWVLSTEWTRAWVITGLVSRWKNDGGPCLF